MAKLRMTISNKVRHPPEDHLKRTPFWNVLSSAHVAAATNAAEVNVRYWRWVQLVTATPLVVYRQEFRIPRFAAGVD